MTDFLVGGWRDFDVVPVEVGVERVVVGTILLRLVTGRCLRALAATGQRVSIDMGWFSPDLLNEGP